MLVAEAIAKARSGYDIRAVRPDLGAQAGDIDINGAVEDNHLVAPDAAQDLFARADPQSCME